MFEMFKQIITVYWEVLCFKRSPLTTPASMMMLNIALSLILIVGVFQFQLTKLLNTTPISFFSVIGSIILQIALFAIYSRVVLKIQKADKYYMQLFICWLMMLFFLDLISSLLMCVMVGFSYFGFAAFVNSFLIYFAFVFGIIFSLWQVSFIVHLFRVFLKLSIWMGLLYYLGWLLLNYLYLIILKSI
jgi:hypothetical protein